MRAARKWALRQAVTDSERELEPPDRYVDFGIRLRVVEMDLEHGVELIPGTPPLRVLREHRFGGLVDTTAKPLPVLCGPSRRSRQWLCSVEQEPLILHGAGRGPIDTDRLLVDGSEGAGKTRVLAMWMILRSLALMGAGAVSLTILATAPTVDRLTYVRDALEDAMDAGWYHWTERRQTYSLRNGMQVRLLATKRSSEAVGEKTQGMNAAAAASDEIQDTTQDAEDGIEMRGRQAPQGRYRRICTASVKDSPVWRSRRDKRKTSDLWTIKRLIGPNSPFQWPRFWSEKMDTMSLRAYQRRVLAMDLPPENRVYTSWQRDENLRPPWGVDVTEQRTGGYAILVGYDPGQIADVSLLLKCYHHKSIDRWWVIDELTTPRTTTEEHAIRLIALLQDKHRVQYRGADEPKALVRCDPYGDTDSKTDRSVYLTFKQLGLRILSAAYNTRGQGKGRVPKDPGIEMVNRLFCNASGLRRLFIDCDENRTAVAPELIAAVETQERDEGGHAEVKVRGVKDTSHWTAALRYALWPYERVRDLPGLRQVAGVLR